MLTWRDGLESTPDGELAREIPQQFTWSSSAWITADGNAWRRYFNAVDRSHSWERLELTLDAHEERLGLHLPAWTSLEQAICLAWRRRLPGSRAHVRSVDPRAPPHADTLRWGEEEDGAELPATIDGETWEPLQWTCGGLARCSPLYEISSLGRLRSPHSGEVTCGLSYRGARWAACRGAGLVNLTAAAGLRRESVTLQPREMHAYRAMAQGLTPPEYAKASKKPLPLAWSYCSVVVPHVPQARRLVARDLRRALESLRGDPALGGRLTELYPKVAPLLPRPLEMGELRFSRVAVLSATRRGS